MREEDFFDGDLPGDGDEYEDCIMREAEARNQAWEEISLTTMPDGTVEGHVSTNDNLDRGYPSEYADWPVKYRSREYALKHYCGGSHYGISGVRVTVFLDGEEVVPSGGTAHSVRE